MRTSQNGDVVHTVTVPGPSYGIRASKFAYDPGPPEAQPEPPGLFKPFGYFWTAYGAVGYVTKLVLDDSHDEIDEQTWWVSVKPYNGASTGTESSRIEITIDDPASYTDAIFLAALPTDTSIADGDTSRIQIWISENEQEFYHLEKLRLSIVQDEDSDIINWSTVAFHAYAGTNPSPPYFNEILSQGSSVQDPDILWIPTLKNESDSRTADFSFHFANPTPSYGVSVGSLGYAGYVDIPTKSGSSGEFTVQLVEYDAQQQLRTYYRYGNSEQYNTTFDGVSSGIVTVDIS